MDRLIPPPEQALAAWAAMVRANRQQAERVRETPPGSDFYAPVSDAFRADPRRTDEPALELVRQLVVPGERWLDIGAGGGRYALPLALAGARVTAIEPSPAMRTVLGEAMSEHEVRGIEVVDARWPADGHRFSADVALISHVGYDVEEMGPFIEAMEAAAKRLCVALLLAEAPASLAAPFWRPIHGEERARLPALPEFLALLLARGRFFEVRRAGERRPPIFDDLTSAQRFLRFQLFLEEGSEKDRKLESLLKEMLEGTGAAPGGGAPLPVGLVTWEPPQAS